MPDDPPTGRRGDASEALLRRLDRYLDAVPRTAARPERLGAGLVLFVPANPAGWRYYARPQPGGPPPTADDVAAARRRQRELGLPEEFEWVGELSPAMSEAVKGAGLGVELRPLLVLDDPAALARAGHDVHIAGPDDDLALICAVQVVGFGNPGTAVEQPGSRSSRRRRGARRPRRSPFCGSGSGPG